MVELPYTGRRRFLASVIKTIFAAIGSILALVLGGSVVSPGFARRQETWLPAARLSSLDDDTPTPITLRIVRPDGYTEAVDRQVIFLLKTGENEVRAFSSTCTHLGCRVSWDPAAKLIKCPCHGGVYSVEGKVVAGPPPRPLPGLATRVDGNQVLVQL